MIVPVYVKDFLPLDAHNTCHCQSPLIMIGPHPQWRLTQTAHILSSLQYVLFSDDQDGGFIEGYSPVPKTTMSYSEAISSMVMAI